MPPAPPHRLGPRPLPLHLGTALMTWASCESAWKLWKQGLPSSRPSSSPGSATPDTAAALLPQIAALEANTGSGSFEAALRREIARRLHRLADGVLAYRNNPVRRTLDEPPVAWSEGSTRLLDFGATHPGGRARGRRAVLVVPSLINRWEVLDLAPHRSLLRAMAGRGLRPYLVDWGTPNADERRFDIAAYVTRLEGALAFLARRAGRAPAVMGYCMGGTLAVALAARRPRRVAGLALLAAPWDFHADKTGHAFLLSAAPLLAEVAERVGELPVDILQTLFWSLDPWLAVKKFPRLLGLDPKSDQAREFVLLEDWLNGGAPLAGPTARECLIGWYGENLTGTDSWIVGGRRIVPSRINVPALVMIPSGDRIVPPPSAAALAAPATRAAPGNARGPAAGPHRHGGERPRAGSVLDAADRLARCNSSQATQMIAWLKRVDWRVPATWGPLLVISILAHAYVEVADRGHRIGWWQAVMLETTSHLMIAFMLPAIYWLHRHFPLATHWRNILVHALAVVPFSLIHTAGMAQLRLLWFVDVMGEPYRFPLTADRFLYEFTKDVVTYLMLSAAVVAIRYLLERHRLPEPVLTATTTPAATRPERFAVRRRGGKEVMIEVDDIDWIEAAGNYAILHVGGDRLEIRSSLSKLETELDPHRFVRVHKSHMVNIARVAEVTPWVSGDWRIRLQDGAEMNLSRRYRDRFEALAPVKG